jgi:uncharacterized protein (DUF849 family)
VLIQACLNGARDAREHPALPRSPDELARDAAACVAAGARSLHVHPRDGDGAESLEPEVVEAAVAAIRRAARGVELTISTGLWIADGDPEARAALVRSWTVLPDACSVNVAEPGWRELIRLLAERGVAVEAGLWSHDGAVAFAASGLEDRCLRALVEPQEREPGAAMVTAAAIDGVLAEVGVPLPRLHHGYDTATWYVLDAAVPAGRDIRIGFEDTLTLPEGARAPDNAALVACARDRYA